MITRDEIIHKANEMLLGSQVVDIIDILIAERDAYREGWIRDVANEPGLRKPIVGLDREGFEQYVDAEANTLLSKPVESK